MNGGRPSAFCTVRWEVLEVDGVYADRPLPGVYVQPGCHQPRDGPLHLLERSRDLDLDKAEVLVHLCAPDVGHNVELLAEAIEDRLPDLLGRSGADLDGNSGHGEDGPPGLVM